MKQIVYILVIILVVSCANESKRSESSVHEIEVSTDINDDFKSENFNPTVLASEKLTEYFDLIKLKQEHPEFREDIELQLESYSANSILLNTNTFSIENIRSADSPEIISDSLQSVVLYFDILSENYITKDSILAFITTKTILMDTQSAVSTKVRFQKIRP